MNKKDITGISSKDYSELMDYLMDYFIYTERMFALSVDDEDFNKCVNSIHRANEKITNILIKYRVPGKQIAYSTFKDN